MICSVIVHLFALHLGTAQHYNSEIPGAGVECTVVSNFSVAAGGYKNSDGDRSAYAVVSQDWKLTDSFSAGMFVGTVNGYQWRNNGNWDYFAGIESSFKLTDKIALRAQLIPRPDPNTKAVIGIGVSYNFNVGE